MNYESHRRRRQDDLGRSTPLEFEVIVSKVTAQAASANMSPKRAAVPLDFFVENDNCIRPHRALNRRTPLEVFSARDKAVPTGPKIDANGYRTRHDKMDVSGCVTVGHRGQLHHIGLGRPSTGWRVITAINGLDIRILGLDGSPLRAPTACAGAPAPRSSSVRAWVLTEWFRHQ